MFHFYRPLHNLHLSAKAQILTFLKHIFKKFLRILIKHINVCHIRTENYTLCRRVITKLQVTGLSWTLCSVSLLSHCKRNVVSGRKRKRLQDENVISYNRSNNLRLPVLFAPANKLLLPTKLLQLKRGMKPTRLAKESKQLLK